MQKYIYILLALLISSLPALAQIEVGAERMDSYLPLLSGKRVGVIANHTTLVGETHLIDTLHSRGVDIRYIFSPEHGFRGNADAGEKVKSYVDKQTGIKVVSLYGASPAPPDSIMKNIDV